MEAGETACLTELQTERGVGRAAGMAATANDVCGFCFSFAISTAIIAVFARGAMAGRVCTLLLVAHEIPLTVGDARALVRFALSHGEGLVQILNEIVRILESDGETEQRFGRARGFAFNRRAVFDERVRSTEAGGAENYFQSRCNRERFRASTADFEGEHASEILHLAFSDLIPRIVREARIADFRDAFVR